MNRSSLIVNNLTRSISSEYSLEQLSFTINQGSKVALLGLNGAGKSSLIRLLNGETSTDQGQIIYPYNKKQLSPNDIEFKSSQGVQNDTMLAISQMTGREYLTLCCRLKKIEKAELSSNIKKLIQQWSIESIVDRPMSQLSKGNQQKLAIAQAFIGKPNWLFFDEPCQSLDPIEQERFNKNIMQLEEIALCLFSTHNVSHALEVADEILFFHQSKLAFHFTNCQSKNKNEHTYLLVTNSDNDNLSTLAKQQNIHLESCYKNVYRIHEADADKISQFRESIEKEKFMEFLLSENEAIMPLFRLVASGELALLATSSSTTEKI